MPSECCVPMCKRRGGHKFPWRNPKLMEAWKVAIKRGVADKPGQVWKPSRHSLVCGHHFDGSDYKTTSYYGQYCCP